MRTVREPIRVEDSIRVGDTVQMTAGGPVMRAHLVRRGAVRCVWFEEGAKNFGYFKASLLVRIVAQDFAPN